MARSKKPEAPVNEAETLPFAELPSVEGRRVFALRGRLGPIDAVALRELALAVAPAGQPIGFDCREVEVLGGAALQIMLALQQALGRVGASASENLIPSA